MKEKVIHSLFDNIAIRFAEKVAIKSSQRTITYFELLRNANQLADCLISKGIQSGDMIIVHIKSSIELVTAMLAISKSGGVYVPIDESFSLERTTQIFNKTFDGTIITSIEFANDILRISNLLDIQPNIIVLENNQISDWDKETNHFSKVDPNLDCNSDSFQTYSHPDGGSYVFYTRERPVNLKRFWESIQVSHILLNGKLKHWMWTIP